MIASVAGGLPTGTVTFLFTDLEFSTRLWEEHPEAMRVALAGHDQILRDAIDAHGGQVVKTRGDGFHAAFATAADGVGAALDAQVALAGASWPEVGVLRVRMGLHTGVAEIRDGDYYGSALNRAARLMSVALAGQVVVSQVTEELVLDFLAAGVESVDLGEHRLRDLASPIRVFQIVHPDLERDTPRPIDRYKSAHRTTTFSPTRTRHIGTSVCARATGTGNRCRSSPQHFRLARPGVGALAPS